MRAVPVECGRVRADADLSRPLPVANYRLAATKRPSRTHELTKFVRFVPKYSTVGIEFVSEADYARNMVPMRYYRRDY